MKQPKEFIGRPTSDSPNVDNETREVTFDKLPVGAIFRKAYPPNAQESPYQKKTGKNCSQYCNLDGSEIGWHHLQIMDLPVIEIRPKWRNP